MALLWVISFVTCGMPLDEPIECVASGTGTAQANRLRPEPSLSYELQILVQYELGPHTRMMRVEDATTSVCSAWNAGMRGTLALRIEVSRSRCVLLKSGV